MTKNKDWCSFPDEAINNSRRATSRTGLHRQGVQVASQIKKMKAQAAQGGGGGPQAQPLPAGPL